MSSPIPFHLLKRVDRELAKIGYKVVCSTCQKLFFQTTVLRVKKALAAGVWKANEPAQWYYEACVHWTMHRAHQIGVYTITENIDTLLYDVSAVFNTQSLRLTEQEIHEALEDLKRRQKKHAV